MKRLKSIGAWLKKNKFVALIILCAVFMRMWRLGDFAMFLADQGRDAIIIKRIVMLEHFPLIGPPSSIGQVYLGPFFYYLVAPFLFLFALNPAGLAFGVSFLSIVGIVLGYYIVRKVLKEKVALVFLVLCTFSYQLIWAARFSWNPNLLPVFAFFTLYFFYKALETKKIVYSFLYGAFFALSFQLHHLAAFLGAPIVLTFIYQFITEKKKIPLLLSPFIAVASFLLISSPLIIFDLKHDFLNTKNLISLFTQQNVVAGGSPLARLLETNHAFWSTILQRSYSQMFSTALGVMFFAALIFLWMRKKDLFVLIHTINFFSFIYLFSILSSARYPHYYGTAYLSFFVLCAYLLASVPKKAYTTAVLGFVISAYIALNAKQYSFITGQTSNQIVFAQRIAESLAPRIDNKPFNFATYPIEFTSEDTFLYFLEKQGLKTANREAKEVTDQMYVLCDREPCRILDSHSWNIEIFGKAKIDTMWEVSGVKIYRLVHEK
ncbi:glycosyltransferase family 39 protein [Candidatus Roizmanbacteria bacterium]|nr:glycosyltransferase family 39 protein [Candidatus Roizmanbacteria bacterium]